MELGATTSNATFHVYTWVGLDLPQRPLRLVHVCNYMCQRVVEQTVAARGEIHLAVVHQDEMP